MKRFKVVLVSFPFDDLTTSKVRPAVCLTEPIGRYGHIVLAFITSRTPEDILSSDLVIDSSHPDFASTGLRVSSTIQLHRLMTATGTVIKRELGVLTPRLQDEVNIRLRELFGLR